MTSAIGILPV
nr:Chain C, MET-THR-SER-ALA-ILE-GLY-ILE-LEU-PRO-VAL [Homo sapiens]6G3J_F Chain F, MET-THR-SER-ALA-ILE-GLY-ILE-LEU-PRO-VAL [Homo sapiens]